MGVVRGVGVEVAAIAGVGVDVGKGAGVGIDSDVELDVGMEVGLGVAAAPQAMAAVTNSAIGRNRIALPLVKKSTFCTPVKVESETPESTGQH